MRPTGDLPRGKLVYHRVMPLLYFWTGEIEITASKTVITGTHRADSDTCAEDGLGLISYESTGNNINTQHQTLAI